MAEKGWGNEKNSVYLVLFSSPSKMGLKVPLADLTRIFTRPLKGLLAMAYAVTGAPGSLSLSSDGISVPDAQLESNDPEIGGQVYHYVVQGGTHTRHALLYSSAEYNVSVEVSLSMLRQL
jgi:hypothetical protein